MAKDERPITWGRDKGVYGYFYWNKHGRCCFQPATKTESTPGLQIIKDIEPYRNVIDGGVVGGRRQHRDFLRAHGCIEVGTEKPKGRKADTGPRKPDRELVEQIKGAARQQGLDWL